MHDAFYAWVRRKVLTDEPQAVILPYLVKNALLTLSLFQSQFSASIFADLPLLAWHS